MSVSKISLCLLVALAACTAMSRTLCAQSHVPIADPLEFNPDFRFFEPVYDMDLAEMKPQKRANTGWFGTYDRAMLWVTRPEAVPNFADTDIGWGNRYDLGYMLEEDNGWLATVWHMGGPNAYDTITVTRVNRFEPEDTKIIDPRFPPTTVDGDSASTDLTLLLPPEDRNDPDLGYRAFNVQDSINVLNVGGFELNKTWRMRPYQHGGILEPFVGLRWIHLRDEFLRQQYDTAVFDLDGDGTPDIATETLVSNQAITKNDLFGGQLGCRYTYFRNRWTLSTDLRVFAGQIFQKQAAETKVETSFYDPTSLDPITVIGFNPPVNPTVFRNDNDEFGFGFDLRAEAAYQLTKYIALRGGLQVYDVAQGVWRGGPQGGRNDQNLLMAGVTFGFTINR
jgi:hypothetical protein